MALSKAATKLLAWLDMYNLTPTEFSDIISGSGYQNWIDVGWFATSVGRVAFGYKPSVKRGLFKTALQELLDDAATTTTTTTTTIAPTTSSTTTTTTTIP